MRDRQYSPRGQWMLTPEHRSQATPIRFPTVNDEKPHSKQTKPS
jgi:hypothetical protein